MYIHTYMCTTESLFCKAEIITILYNSIKNIMDGNKKIGIYHCM